MSKIKIKDVDWSAADYVQVHWSCGSFNGIETFDYTPTSTYIIDRIKRVVTERVAITTRDTLQEQKDEYLQELRERLVGKEIPLF